MFRTYFFLGLGGAAGVIARVALARVLPSFVLNMPVKILSINILGCFLLGVLTEILALYWNASMDMRHFWVQGFLGGFTTFSAFALEFGMLYKEGENITAVVYAVLSVVLCIIFFFVGLKIVRIFSSMLQ